MSLEVLAEAMLDELTARFPLGYRPRIVWKNLRVSAGLADYVRREIRLSRTLLTTDERLQSTLLHEYAHLLAVARHGRKAANHGPLWREAMRELGEAPEVYHTYEVSRAPKVIHIYRCDRCQTRIARQRRLPRNRLFLHAKCGGKVVYVDSETPAGPEA